MSSHRYSWLDSNRRHIPFTNKKELIRTLGISVIDYWLINNENLQISPNSHSQTSAAVTEKALFLHDCL